jgi:hypothetical protein
MVSSFTDSDLANTTHSASTADPASPTWDQSNSATGRKYIVTKTYVAVPSRSVILIEATFDNLSSTRLDLYVDYLPQLNN